MAEPNYKVAGSLNFKRMKKGANISTTIETKSSSVNRLLEQVRRCKGIEGYINHRLYHIHSSSQNYYYVKDINQIVADERTPSTIKFKDLMQDSPGEDLLKRIYKAKEYQSKITKLCEYYKFHKEIPRMFAKDSYDTFFDHHDKKRKVEYIVITKRLREDAGEDLKAELEQTLKKMRDVKYEPLLQDLYLNNQFKSAKSNRLNIKLKTQQSESMHSLQDQLSRIFKVTDLSMSELRMLSITDGDVSVGFSRTLPSELAMSQGIASLRQLSSGSPPPDKPPPKMSKQITLKPNAQRKVKAEPLTHGSGKTTIAPDVIESLKKISLPGGASKPASLGQSKLRSSFSREVDIVDAKVAPPKMIHQEVLLSGAIQLQASSSGIKKGLTKALTREPSLKSTAGRNKSSSSIKRGLAFNKKETDDEIRVVSLKRESSDFRITKKNSLEFEGSQKKIGEVYPSTERRHGSKHSSTPSVANLVNLNLVDSGQGQQGGIYKNSLKAFPSAPKLATKEGSHSVPPKELSRNTSTKNLQLAGKSNPTSPMPNLSNMGTVQNFKVDIDRLLKASGIMDYNLKTDTIMAATNRASFSNNGPFSSSNAKHKYTRSGPEALATPTSLAGLGTSKTMRSHQGSIDAGSSTGLRQTNSTSTQKTANVKNTKINFYVNDHPTERGQTFRISQPQSTVGTARESAFHKKGSFSTTQSKPYLVESTVMEQRGVKLVKKTTHARSTIKKF